MAFRNGSGPGREARDNSRGGRGKPELLRDLVRHARTRVAEAILYCAHPFHPYLLLRGSLVDPRLRASNEHILIVRVPRAGGRPGCPPPLLNLRSPADYSLGTEFPDLNDDLYMKALQPLVDPYLVFWRIDIRHITSLRLAPSQLDVSSTP